MNELLLKAYLDRELSEAQILEVEQELSENPELRSTLGEFDRIGRSLQVLRSEEPAKGKVFVMNKVRPKPLWRNPWVLAGSCCLLLFAAYASFPVFAQAKEASKTMAAYAARRERMKDRAAASASESLRKQPADKESSSAERQERNYAPAAEPLLTQSIIRTASMQIEVPDVNTAMTKVTTLAKGAGGFVTSAGSSMENKVRYGHATIRVRQDQFDQVLGRLRSFGVVKSETIGGEDVTSQIVDQQARLRVMRGEEEQYLTLLRSARKVGEIMSIRDRLSEIRSEIESLTSSIATFKNQAAYSTITLELEEQAKVQKDAENDDWVHNTVVGAINLLTGLGRLVGQLLIFVGILSPLWIPVVAFIAWRRIQSKRTPNRN